MSAYLNFVSVGVLDVWPFTALHELNEASWELRCRNYSESASTPPPPNGFVSVGKNAGREAVQSINSAKLSLVEPGKV